MEYSVWLGELRGCVYIDTKCCRCQADLPCNAWTWSAGETDFAVDLDDQVAVWSRGCVYLHFKRDDGRQECRQENIPGRGRGEKTRIEL